MHLKNLKLIQFKNYRQEQLDFSPEMNCLFGVNGAGKTNLLDAIHYLCLTKSAFNTVDSQNILHESDFFNIQGEFDLEGKPLQVTCIQQAGRKKQFEVNGKPYVRLSEHIGLLPLVLIAPDDTVIINGGSEERRKFFDNIMCQSDKSYLEHLIRYQHYLKQRNALLKNFSEGQRFDRLLLEPFDRQLIQLAKALYISRRTFIEKYLPILTEHYAAISGKREHIHIEYQSDLSDDRFEQVFLRSLDKDLFLKRTGCGVHKDDYIFQLEKYPLKKFGSQGQKKSFLISLKLAQFEVFKKLKGVKPILLLDDIFDKLDDFRISHLMEGVAKGEFGQLFITDARPERSKEILRELPMNILCYTIFNGQIQSADLS
ncbi:DNA replication/repair protein RecF [Negadavirga shengliensis]|uniref:DNA replication and repair protein RecF n=1 Tax=Negadavirga shengliensis TaxID=1389218 RepID=A0ABV9SXJ2_9BACT